jgi:hypothetical protein
MVVGGYALIATAVVALALLGVRDVRGRVASR